MRFVTRLLAWLRPVRSLDEERAAVEARRAETDAKLDGLMPPNEIQIRRDLTR